jgi:hypothetical protein
MDAISELQRQLGGPVVGFIQQHWMWFLIGGFLVWATLFSANNGDGGPTISADGADDDGGDGGGGDGGWD